MDAPRNLERRRGAVRAPIAAILPIVLAAGCATFRGGRNDADAAGMCRQLSREGVAAMEHGDATRACELLQRAVKASPTDVDARRQLAEVLWKRGAHAEASSHMEAATRLDPHHGPTIVRSGEMLHGLGAIDQSLERAERALLVDPTLAGAWALRGRVFHTRGQLDRALADMHQALRYNPHAENVLMETAELQFQLGRPQRCLTTLQSLLEAYPKGEEPRRALWLEGLAFSAIDRPADAASALLAASARGPAEPELLFQLARAQQAAGQMAEAAVTAQQAADAGHEGSRALLAQMHAAGAGAGTLIR